MKMKLKNLKFKELFIEHVEKAVLVVMGICLIMFIFSSIGREKLPPEREPDRLTLQSDNARQHIEKSSFEKEKEKIRPPDAVVYEQSVQRDPVDLATYNTRVEILPPIVKSKVLRDEPIYLPLADLQVGVGFGSIATMDPNVADEAIKFKRKNQPGAMEDMQMPEEAARVVDRQVRKGAKAGKDDKLVVKYWAIVTGLVPVRKQKEEYTKTFESAVNYEPEQDIPKYVGFLIERAEVSSGDLQNLKWTAIQRNEEFRLSWTEEMQDPVMMDYVTPTFVDPLAPLVGEEWGTYVGHPKIPFEPKQNQFGGRGMMPGRRGPMGGEMFEGRGIGGRGFEGEGGFGAGGVGAEGEEDVGDFVQGGQVKRQQAVEEEGPEERRRKQEVVANVWNKGAEKPVKGVDHLLFRYCDFSVEPGKQYVYRVKIGLSNPNRGMPVRFLKRPELADPKPKGTEFSAVSPIALIPYGDRILAGPVTPATVLKEPTGKIRIVQVNDTVGAAVPLEAEVSRGSLANFQSKDTEYIDPRTGEVTDINANFATDSVVVDLRGGRPVLYREKQVTEPGEMLLFTRTGQLLAMNEFDDEDAWKDYVVPEEEERPGMMQEDMPRGPLGPEGMRPMPTRAGRGKKAIQAPIDPLEGGGAPGARGQPKRAARPRGADR